MVYEFTGLEGSGGGNRAVQTLAHVAEETAR